MKLRCFGCNCFVILSGAILQQVLRAVTLYLCCQCSGPIMELCVVTLGWVKESLHEIRSSEKTSINEQLPSHHHSSSFSSSLFTQHTHT